jgi:selenocysteine-specific elongation factor
VLGRVSIASTGVSEIRPGSRSAVRLRLETPAPLVRGDRFILRAYSPAITIGGGQVLDPDPPRAGVRTPAAQLRLRALGIEPNNGAETEAVSRLIADAGGVGLPITSLVSRVGVAPGQTATLVADLERGGHARVAGDRLVSPSVTDALASRLLTIVGDYHKSQPLADGIPREEARERVFARAHPAVFERVLADLAANSRLVVRDRLALPGHRLSLTPEEARVRAIVEAAHKRAGLSPPDLATLAAESKTSTSLVERMIALLVRQKTLVRVDTLVFHAETLNSLRSEIHALKATAADGRATVDVATFKDRYGITRKFAIPLLEWLDRERVTRRVGETRIVL